MGLKFIDTTLKGAFVIELNPFYDERGMFARTFCANEFKERRLVSNMVQSNLSVTIKKNTIRGMHYQVNGAEEVKLVRCIRGKILDVILDVRPSSDSFGNYFKVELSDQNNKMVYVPEGFAHGFLTMEDYCHVFYQVSNFYSPNKERGIRWNDPSFGINWPVVNPIMSEKDRNYKLFVNN